MDLSALPLVAVLRWDLAVRALLAVLLPALIGLAVPWLTHAAVLAAVVAAMVSLSSLGPDLGQPRWTALAVVATPVAVTLGAWLAPTAGGGVLLVLLLFVVQGALTQAGLVGQLAWFPVSSAGLVAAALSPGRASLLAVAAAAAAGAAWAGLLVLLVPRVVRVPRLALPEGALAVDTPRLRRMVMRPHWRDWTFPLLLGGLSALLLVLAGLLTGGFRAYWVVFALVAVLGPTSAATRQSAWETVAAAMVGIALAGVLVAWDPDALVVVACVLALAVAGALVLLRNGMLSKALLTPLPVVFAARAAEGPGSGALGLRLVEFLVGAGVGLAAAVASEWLVQRLERDRAGAGAAQNTAPAA